MKTVTVRDLQKKVKECVEEAQQDRVVITRHGKPAGVLMGFASKDDWFDYDWSTTNGSQIASLNPAPAWASKSVSAPRVKVAFCGQRAVLSHGMVSSRI